MDRFIEKVKNPLVVVSTLKQRDREAVVDFLRKINAPVYLEGVSGLREDSRLGHLRISYIHNLWENSKNAGYPIDGILRIGGVPTFRSWRDLESKKNQIEVCSVSHLPFSGLSWGPIIQASLSEFLGMYNHQKRFETSNALEWLEFDRACHRALCQLLHEEPLAEPSYFHSLSQQIPKNSMVYLGNSSPIREWDLAAAYDDQQYTIFASRGLNGIDGQISTFLGLCQEDVENWAILGDLTALYDLAGPWILKQLANIKVNIVVVNNGGGKIFSRMFPHEEFQNRHQLSFRPIADFWGLEYELLDSIFRINGVEGNRLIEIQPDAAATERFWQKYSKLPEALQYAGGKEKALVVSKG
ncbi:MAG: 2-succinyl-5-enolpyruvyl-6-hydroxy-3-cyclohexene-1-carboxylate synthase [Chlamydiae bacterium]|nr:2-succinyl-5-enolpyruvyl-6-hydroxy-3-cyclohexene-1-carboxylate synthase [Chlamydiota bacterium]